MKAVAALPDGYREIYSVDLKNDNRDFAKPDTNIRILGLGRAILDGGNYNGLSERNSLKDGMPYIGLYSKATPNLYVATGFQKWGMSTSMA